MNPNTQETQPEMVQNQVKVDTNLDQVKVDTNLQQQPEGDPNWKAFREQRKREAIEKAEAIKRANEKEAENAALKAAMEAALANTPRQYSNQEPQDETEDERLEKKIQAAIAKRDAEFHRQMAENEKKALPQKLLQAFPDYEQVVNEENGAYLEYHHPELYRSLLRQPENFESCSDIYKVVKKLIPNSTTAKKEAAKADANFAKPKSMSTTGLSQMGEATASAKLSAERKAANWERMQKLLKGVS
jgi:hypothetical protein